MLKRVFKGFRPNWPALRDYRVRVGLYEALQTFHNAQAEAEPLLRKLPEASIQTRSHVRSSSLAEAPRWPMKVQGLRYDARLGSDTGTSKEGSCRASWTPWSATGARARRELHFFRTTFTRTASPLFCLAAPPPPISCGA